MHRANKQTHPASLYSVSPTHIHSDTLHTHSLWCEHTLSCKPIDDPSNHLKIKAQINNRNQKQNETQTTIKIKILQPFTIIISAWEQMKARKQVVFVHNVSEFKFSALSSPDSFRKYVSNATKEGLMFLEVCV